MKPTIFRRLKTFALSKSPILTKIDAKLSIPPAFKLKIERTVDQFKIVSSKVGKIDVFGHFCEFILYF